MGLIGRHFGHIRVTQVVGQGGMGDVYGGYDEKLERKVALKVLNDDQRLDDEARERLLREARALSKLDHPNICRIHDYIETPDLDLLVLEYIDGQTLHDAMQSGISHHEKLRIAIAIAGVLVQAHRAGIVHRDLKPENVMLTKSGEVKVLDFGLARWLHHKRKSSDKHVAVRSSMRAAVADATETTKFSFDDAPRNGSPRRDFLATAVGITLGTPLFMSPEQARGETLTPASDMFSFGLVLQTLFTGEDPHPIGLTAREVILRVARGETQPVKGAPGDVTALLNRLKQFAPADRPTAVETAERLRFLHAKPQRIARRSIIAVIALIALLGAWRYTVDLKRERAIAVRERAAAEAGRSQAESLLEFMLGDLRKKLEPVGRLDILEEAAQRSLGYFSSLDASALSAPDLIRNAKALHQLGDVRIAQGKLDDAMVAFRQSLSLAEAAERREPRNAEAQLAVGTSHFWIGNAYRMKADVPRALVHWTEYMKAGEELAAAYPGNDEYRLERAQGHGNVATLLETQGDLRGALAHNRVAMEIKKARVDAAPMAADRQAEYAITLNKVGFVLQRLGDLTSALEHFQREFTILSSLVANDAANSRLKQKLATSRSYIAAVLESMGRDDEALEQRLAESVSERQLYDSDHANVDWQRNLAITQTRVADVLRRRGDVHTAATWVATADSLMRDLVRRPSARPTWRRDLAVVLIGTARVHLRASDSAAALEAAGEAIRLLDSPPPNDPTWFRFLAEAQLARGEALTAAGQSAEAQMAFATAREAIETAARTSTDPAVLDIKARTVLWADSDANPLLQQLERLGYRHRDLVNLVNQRREAAEGE
ncbi:MAG: serine/threonine-protein kinase [Acidobacteriota bacterium]|nr:serine/threonine-protein kinase [Acidobacteriota bacterium]